MDAILDGAADVLRQHGLEGTSTTRIAERAGVSIGSLYQYFPNKLAIYRALGERFFGRIDAVAEAIFPALASLPPREAIDTAVRGVISASFLDPALDRILHHVAISRADFEPVAGFEARQEARLAALLRARARELPRPLVDPDLTARVLIRALGGVVSSTCAREPSATSDIRLIDELIRLIEHHLGF